MAEIGLNPLGPFFVEFIKPGHASQRLIRKVRFSHIFRSANASTKSYNLIACTVFIGPRYPQNVEHIVDTVKIADPYAQAVYAEQNQSVVSRVSTFLSSW